MSKSILVITGSPRKNGNSELLADAFIKGAEAKGHKVNKFQAAFKNIQGCRACDSCWTNGTACIFKDGFTELEPLLEAADVIVLASPLYWFGLSSHIKAPIDKLYSYVSPLCKRPLKIKESILLSTGEGEEISIFDGLIQSFKEINKYMGWKEKGILLVKDVFEKGKVKETEMLEKAAELGKKI